MSRVIPQGIPAGVIFPYGGYTAPKGYVLCDGRTLSRTAYAGLFAAISTIHGAGDGSTTFHVPDYRGRFLRGSDNMGTGEAGRDPDRYGRTPANSGGDGSLGVGSIQDAMFSWHHHGGGNHSHVINANIDSTGGFAGGGNPLLNRVAGARTANSGDTIAGQGGNENRPINANVNYIIKI